MKPNLHSSRFGRAAWAVVWLLLFPAAITAVEKAQGAAFQVNSTRDGDDAAPGDGFCETATTGQCTLRAAIQEANSQTSNDSIGFAIPTSEPGFDPETGRHTINLTKALPVISTNLEINGPGANKLTVRRNTGGSYRVFDIRQPDPSFFGRVSLSGMTITRGYSDSGGGIYVSGSILSVSNCIVTGNSVAGANALGGGIFSDVHLIINNSAVSGNSAGIGGGIYNDGTTYVINSTVAGNFALQEAGGIRSKTINRGTDLNITNSTISGNSAPVCGGVSNDHSSFARIKSSIIALNTANQNPDLGGTGPYSYTSQGFNLIGDADGVTFNAQTTDQIGSSATPLDARLDPNGLQDNGGATQTIALLFGSPAIDQGTSDGLTSPAVPTGPLTTDQRGAGFTRPFDNAANPNATGGDGTDIGAFEVQSTSTTPGLSTLGNISTRSLVQTGDNVLIAGFIVVGSNPRKVIVRAIGPSLPLPGNLADPTLELRDANGGLVRENDNWRTGGQEAEIIATTIPPTNDLESAIVATLPANNASYTGIVRGVGGTTGIAVVEVYAIN